jgi:hypothetical protein
VSNEGDSAAAGAKRLRGCVCAVGCQARSSRRKPDCARRRDAPALPTTHVHNGLVVWVSSTAANFVGARRAPCVDDGGVRLQLWQANHQHQRLRDANRNRDQTRLVRDMLWGCNQLNHQMKLGATLTSERMCATVPSCPALIILLRIRSIGFPFEG